MKKFKYLLLIMLATFISVSSVNAVTGNPNTNGTIFLTPYAGDFADNTNGQLTRIGSYFSNDYKGFASNSQITLNGANTHGANLIFDALQPFVAGYTYALSVLISLGPGVPLDVYPKASSTRVCIAETGNNAVTRFNNPSQFPCTNAYVTNTIGSPAWWNVEDGTNDLRQYGLLTYVFTADFTATAITLSYNSSQPITSYHAFGGYVVEVLSDNNNISQDEIRQAVQSSGIATATDANQIRAGINEVKQEINGMQQQQQQTNEKLDDLNENITSDDVSKSEDEASSFFDNFSTTDNGGISAIVTAPLVAIERMLEGTCQPLTATYSGKTISLPCGYSFWNDMPEIKKFLNIVLGGFLCYGILAKLYLLIDRLKNPEDDRVDVMKL